MILTASKVFCGITSGSIDITALVTADLGLSGECFSLPYLARPD